MESGFYKSMDFVVQLLYAFYMKIDLNPLH